MEEISFMRSFVMWIGVLTEYRNSRLIVRRRMSKKIEQHLPRRRETGFVKHRRREVVWSWRKKKNNKNPKRRSWREKNLIVVLIHPCRWRQQSLVWTVKKIHMYVFLAFSHCLIVELRSNFVIFRGTLLLKVMNRSFPHPNSVWHCFLKWFCLKLKAGLLSFHIII